MAIAYFHVYNMSSLKLHAIENSDNVSETVLIDRFSIKIDRLSTKYWCFQESLVYLSISCCGPTPGLNPSQLPHKKGRNWSHREFLRNSFHYTVDSELRELSAPNQPLAKYELRKPHEQDYPIFPSALRPSYQDSRIRGQRSVFTIHGQRFGFEKLIKEVLEIKGLEKIPFLGMIEINKGEVTQLKNEVMQMGINRSILFPDLTGTTGDLVFEYTKGSRSRFPVGEDREQHLLK